MKVAVVGGRDFDSKDLLYNTLDARGNIDLVVTGDAAGADALARRYATDRNIPLTVFRADWEQYGRAAGPKRNTHIVTSEAEVIIAFWDGKSRGTKNSIQQARSVGKDVVIVNYPVR